MTFSISGQCVSSALRYFLLGNGNGNSVKLAPGNSA